MSQGNSVLYNERRAVILPPKMPLWHADYFEIQLHKKWMMKQGNIKDMQRNYLENKYTKQYLSRYLITLHASAQLC